MNIETRLDLGEKSCKIMIFKLDFQLQPFWPFWSWNFEYLEKNGVFQFFEKLVCPAVHRYSLGQQKVYAYSNLLSKIPIFSMA